jgi:hypothetical protein
LKLKKDLILKSVQGPLIEGRLYGLNYEAVLSGPMVIPFKKIVEIHSGTSSLQGKLKRQLIMEVPPDAESRMGFKCIHYALEETVFKIQGPATALQVLQVRLQYLFYTHGF